MAAETRGIVTGPALVTGAAGFLGRHLCRRLAKLGVQIHATSRSDRGDDPELESVRWHRVDLTDAAAIAQLVERVRPNVVIHLAGLVTGRRDRALVVPALQANLDSTVCLLDAATSVGVRRFVHVGSMEEPALDLPAPVPMSPYQASKIAATSYCRMYAALYGLDVAIARVFMVYGPGRQDERKLVPYVIRSLLDGRVPRLASGARRVDWVYVDDVVEGLVRLAGTVGLAGRSIDLGSGELVPIRRVVELIYRALGRSDAPAFGALQDRVGEPEVRADIARSSALLGWSPRTPLADGIARTVEWLRANPSGAS